MAILTKIKLLAQQRLDLEDINALLNSLSADSRAETKQFWANGAYVLKGFVVSALGTPSPAQISIDGSTLINANSDSFSWFVGPAGAASLSVPLVANSKNYIELELTAVDGTPLPRAFWDPTANNGSGGEFTQTVNTATEVKVSAVVSTTGFSGSNNRIKIAIVQTDAGNGIAAIIDRRELFFRLGTASNPLNNYAWSSQTEPSVAVVLTGGSGTYVAGETVTFSGGATAKVLVGGTTNIQLINFSGDNFSFSDTLVGGTSGASRTVFTLLDSFTGADKSIDDLKSALAAIQTEIKALKGTDNWFTSTSSSIEDLLRFNNNVMMAGPSVPDGRYSWDGANLSLTGTGSLSTDTISVLRLLSSSSNLNLNRADGTGGTSVIPIPSGSVLFITLPDSGNRTYSGNGSSSTNYQVVSRSAFISNKSNFWLAYNEGGTLRFRGGQQLDTGESIDITESVSENLLSTIGIASDTSSPSYSSNIRGTVAESLVARLGVLTDAIGDEQEDRSAFLRSNDPVNWSGTQLSFTSDIVLEILNTKSGTSTAHTILTANSPISLTNGQIAYVVINRLSASENVTPVIASSLPAQTQANKDVIVLFKRVDAGGAAFLHIPLHKQVIEQAQTVRLGASGSGSGGSSGVNYISNSNFDANTNNWNAYADAAGTTPVDGTGGSPTVTITRSTSSPLRGVGSGVITKDAANRQGQGVSYDFTIDSADQAKPLAISFDYQPSANFVAGDLSDLKVFIYDVTNALLIQPAPLSIQGGSSNPHKFIATFQTAYNSTSYRLIFHVATTNALAWTFKFDGVSVGPQITNFGAPISDWVAFTPTGSWVSNTTYTGFWRRVGDSMEIRYKVLTSGAPTSTILYLDMPTGYVIDVNKIPTNQVGEVGVGTFSDNDAAGYSGPVLFDTTTRVRPNYHFTAQDNPITDTAPFTWNNGDYGTFRILVPILGWGSNVEMSNDTDTRVVAASVYLGPSTNQTINNAIETKVGFNSIDFDTHGAFDPTTNYRYTVPVSGIYRLSGHLTYDLTTGAGDCYVALNKNGSDVIYQHLPKNGSANLYHGLPFDFQIKANAGDYFEIYTYQATGGSLNLLGIPITRACGLNIERLSGPSAIAATETVSLRYSTTDTTAFTSFVTKAYSIKEWDSHGAYNTSNGKFTAPVSGIYDITWNAVIGSVTLSTSQSFNTQLIKNGATIVAFTISNGTGGVSINYGLTGKATVRLLAGETLELQLFSAVSVGLNGSADGNHLSITRIGNYS